MAREWFAKVSGSDIGPMEPAELMQLVRQGQIGPDNLVRQGPNGQWIPAKTINGLFVAPPSASVSHVEPPKRKRSLLFWVAMAPIALIGSCCVCSGIMSVNMTPEQREKLANERLAAKEERAARDAERQKAVAETPTGTESSKSPRSSVTPKAVTKAPPSPAPPYEEIAKKAKDLTDAQWDLYSRELRGKYVDWMGRVTEVNKKTFGGYEVWLDLDPADTPFSVQDLYCPVPESRALSISKEQSMTVRGTISSVTNVLGKVSIKLDSNATIE